MRFSDSGGIRRDARGDKARGVYLAGPRVDERVGTAPAPMSEEAQTGVRRSIDEKRIREGDLGGKIGDRAPQWIDWLVLVVGALVWIAFLLADIVASLVTLQGAGVAPEHRLPLGTMLALVLFWLTHQGARGVRSLVGADPAMPVWLAIVALCAYAAALAGIALVRADELMSDGALTALLWGEVSLTLLYTAGPGVVGEMIGFKWKPRFGLVVQYHKLVLLLRRARLDREALEEVLESGLRAPGEWRQQAAQLQACYDAAWQTADGPEQEGEAA